MLLKIKWNIYYKNMKNYINKYTIIKIYLKILKTNKLIILKKHYLYLIKFYFKNLIHIKTCFKNIRKNWMDYSMMLNFY